MNANTLGCLVVTVALLGLGCATYPENPQLESYDKTVGYRFANSRTSIAR